MITEVKRVLNEANLSIDAFPIEPWRLAELLELKDGNKISSSAMQTVFNAMLERNENPETIAKELNLMQVSDTSFLEPLVLKVIEDNPDEAKRYREGKKGLIGFFVGQVMRQSAGKANPQMVTQMVQQKLES
jgi:aspartyl-tRNA(Asn)/glutamyl-tRNA(Gln) amidotransferase subunit B